MLDWLLKTRRARILAQPFPPNWESCLRENVAHFELLSEREQNGLRRGVQVFVAEKYWEGCQGLVVNDEIRVSIAGQACLMLLGIEHDYFRAVQTILIYPTSFRIPGERGKYHGQSHHRGPIILSWDRVLAEGRDPSRGENLVIHEFAHQLDEMDGYVNGTPYLADREMAERWHYAMFKEFSQLRNFVRNGVDTFLGDYAATSDAEFFSVASERFFTQPELLKSRHSAVYDLLAEFYRVDPMLWFLRTGRDFPHEG